MSNARVVSTAAGLCVMGAGQIRDQLQEAFLLQLLAKVTPVSDENTRSLLTLLEEV